MASEIPDTQLWDPPPGAWQPLDKAMEPSPCLPAAHEPRHNLHLPVSDAAITGSHTPHLALPTTQHMILF